MGGGGGEWYLYSRILQNSLEVRSSIDCFYDPQRRIYEYDSPRPDYRASLHDRIV